MTSPKNHPVAASTEAAHDPISLAKLSPELARSNFHALLLANPNFFGNLANSEAQAVLNISGDTAYESLGCVGYNPQSQQLRAVINIKLSSGYSGGLCSSGSDEYVRFYLSYDNGATWQDQGIRAVNVFDVTGPKPLEYAVSLNISPSEEFCFIQNLPLVRAILSWDFPPPALSPNWTPVWGDVKDVQIQIDGFEFILLEALLADAKLKLPKEFALAVDIAQPIHVAEPKTLSPIDLHEMYKGKNVPLHRYLATSLAAAVGPTANTAKASLSYAVAAKQVPSFAGIADINLTNLVEAWLNTQGNTTYEELDCVGLDINASQLAGVLRVKQSSGFSGGPCTAGSTEFVAFWVDWGAGFEYAGVTSVGVHDFSQIPSAGLEYNVFLPVDLLTHAQPCWDGPKFATVRAVLSWNTPPSTTNPYAPVVWGNSRQGTILIPSGQIIGNGQQVPVLSAVGDIDVSLIGGDGRITNANAITTGAHFSDAPFGGQITLAGAISNPAPGLKYRVMKAPHGTSNFNPVVNEPLGLTLGINTFSGGLWGHSEQTFHADAQGYYPYQDYSPDHFVDDQLLGVWYTSVADSGNAYDLRVDLSIDGNPAHDLQSDVVTVLVNNETPGAVLTPSFGECGKLAPGDTFTGVFTATATDFGSFGFTILPPGPANGVLPAPPSGVSLFLGGSIADPGVTSQAFTLDTTGMDPCGYSLTLGVWDRTNVNSGQTNNYNQSSIGFCLQTSS